MTAETAKAGRGGTNRRGITTRFKPILTNCLGP